MSNINGNGPEDEVVSGSSIQLEQKKTENAGSDANQNVAANLGESSVEGSKKSEAMKTEAPEPVNPWAGLFGEEMSPAITTFNYKTGKKIDPTDAVASKAVVEENWDQFYLDHSIDELLEVVRLTSAEKDLARISKAFSIKFAEETNGATGMIESGGLGPNRLLKIGALIERIGDEACIDTRIQLLDILIKILNRFNDEFVLLCSEDLNLFETVDKLLAIHLTIVKEETNIVDEFQLLMTLSEWADKAKEKIEAMELAKKVEALKAAEAEKEIEALKFAEAEAMVRLAEAEEEAKAMKFAKAGMEAETMAFAEAEGKAETIKFADAEAEEESEAGEETESEKETESEDETEPEEEVESDEKAEAMKFAEAGKEKED